MWALIIGAVLATAGGAAQNWLQNRNEDLRHRRDRLDRYRAEAVAAALEAREAMRTAIRSVRVGGIDPSPEATRERVLDAYPRSASEKLTVLNLSHPDPGVAASAEALAEALTEVWFVAVQASERQIEENVLLDPDDAMPTNVTGPGWDAVRSFEEAVRATAEE